MDRKNYRLIVFDLDGTLLDSSPGIINSVRFAQEKMELPQIPVSELYRFIGPPPKLMYQQVFGLDEAQSLQATAFHRQYSRERAIYEASVYSGMPELLSALKQGGYKLAVATLKGQAIAETVLSLFGLETYFDSVVGMDPDETYTKRKTIELAMEHTGITDAGEVLMVGDSEYDAQGAWAAGVGFVGAVYGFGISADEQRFDLIHTPLQLLTLI